MNWFYEKDGAQQGPVTEQALKDLVAAGGLAGHNLIWREGMADWSAYSSVFPYEAPAAASASTLTLGKRLCPTCGTAVSPAELIPAGDRQVCPHCRDSYVQGLKEGVVSTAGLSGGRGTGGMTPNSELRTMARDALSGRWGTGVLSTFVFMLIQQGSAMIPGIGPLIQYVIGGPLMIGYHGTFLSISRGEPAEVGDVFGGFSMFLRGLGVYFMTAIIIGMATLAAVIPGGLILVVAFMGDSVNPEESPLFLLGIAVMVIPAVIVGIYMYLRYALVYFIVNDAPELGVFEVLKASVQKMDGHKGKLFWLYVSFIPWTILGFLALFIGILWAMTYMQAAFAAFYDDIDEGV